MVRSMSCMLRPTILVMAGFSFVACGCASSRAGKPTSVSTAWQHGDTAGTDRPPATGEKPRTPEVVRERQAASVEDTVATVNGRSISRALLTDVLIRSHGATLLEQMIGLQAAWQSAEERGLAVTADDVDREFVGSLKRMVNVGAPPSPDPFDRNAAEQLLGAVLAQRNMSRDEFDIVVRRNAYLRRIVESDQKFNEEQLREEYERTHGPRVQIRHMQLPSLAEIERVKDRLREGEDFADLATRYSANTGTARAGGLLDPFSAGDDEVPSVLREAAFALRPGDVSAVLRVGEWYHLIKVEKAVPPDETPFEQARGEVERSLRERLTEPAMYAHFEKLFRSATIEIRDPLLRAAFEGKHPDRVR